MKSDISTRSCFSILELGHLNLWHIEGEVGYIQVPTLGQDPYRILINCNLEWLIWTSFFSVIPKETKVQSQSQFLENQVVAVEIIQCQICWNDFFCVIKGNRTFMCRKIRTHITTDLYPCIGKPLQPSEYHKENLLIKRKESFIDSQSEILHEAYLKKI